MFLNSAKISDRTTNRKRSIIGSLRHRMFFFKSNSPIVSEEQFAYKYPLMQTVCVLIYWLTIEMMESHVRLGLYVNDIA